MFPIWPCPGRAPDRAKQTKWGIFKCHFWGILLRQRQLVQGTFHWQEGVMRLTAAQLGALLEGLDWRRVHGGRRPIAPQIAA